MQTILNDDQKLQVFSDRLFEKYDTNKNHFIEDDELYNLVIKLSKELRVGYIPTREEIKELFSRLDKDKSKNLDQKEFKQFTKALIKDLLNINEERKKLYK